MATVQKSQLWAVDFPGMGVQTPGVDDMSALPCGGAQGALGGTEEWGGCEAPRAEQSRAGARSRSDFPNTWSPASPLPHANVSGEPGMEAFSLTPFSHLTAPRDFQWEGEGVC